MVLPEAALRIQVGDDATMRRQLEHLAEMAERPNITLHVLTFRGGVHPIKATFGLLSFPWEQRSGPTTVYIEEIESRATFSETRHDLALYSTLFEQLRSGALPPGESIDFARRLAKEFPDA